MFFGSGKKQWNCERNSTIDSVIFPSGKFRKKKKCASRKSDVFWVKKNRAQLKFSGPLKIIANYGITC